MSASAFSVSRMTVAAVAFSALLGGATPAAPTTTPLPSPLPAEVGGSGR
jgi:hypothetical protein